MGFTARSAALHADETPLTALAEAVGTPAYVYSATALRMAHAAFRRAIEAHAGVWGDARIAFAVKANGNLSVLKVLAREGCGADTVSEGEIRRALAAGVPVDRIVFSGVGKTDAELAFAVGAGVRQINVESGPELDRLITVAARASRRPDIAVRVNPAVGAGGHAKITTGGRGDKFGVPRDGALALYARAAASPHVRPLGLACHIGSQIVDPAPLGAAFAVLREMTLALRLSGLAVERLDLGGGLGVAYAAGDAAPDLDAYAAMAAAALDGLDVEATFEPGRVLAAAAGVLLTRVIQVTERSDGRRFLVLDAGMNDLARPALYDAWHDVRPVSARAGAKRPYDVVGPVCETGDTFARDRPLPPMQAGDLVVLADAGAYGASMAGEYNSRPLVPEVLVDGARWAVVRPRPSYDDMLSRETPAPWL